MDMVEARALLADVAADLRTRSYPALVAHYIGDTGTRELVGATGVAYCVQIQGVWDTGNPGDLRIMIGIDDGGLRASFRPLTDDFVMSPDGSFVGE
jgi:hypothetical protein